MVLSKLMARRCRRIDKLACERADQILDDALAAAITVARNEMARQYEEEIVGLKTRLHLACESRLRSCAFDRSRRPR